MAYSYVRYSGNGSTTNYTFSFPTISTDHIKVRVNGTLVTNWSFLNASTVQFVSAPTNGAIIDIRRETPKDSAIVNFTDGSVLLERDLDLLATYDLYLAQETKDGLDSSITQTYLGVFDGQSKRITNVADPVAAQDAVTKNWLETTYTDDIEAIALAAATSATASAASATTASTQASNSAASAASSAASYDAFDDRYLGSKTVAPLVDNDGSALLVGAMYWNNVSSKMFTWSGAAWVDIAPRQAVGTQEITATAGQTSFTISGGYNTNSVYVYINGVLQDAVDFTATNGNTVVLASGASAGDTLRVVTFYSAEDTLTIRDAVAASATTATTKAAEAVVSATSASSSASAASGSATAAATSATNSATSATGAAASATTATTQATNAASSASTASTAATNAASSATAASGSATTATAQAANASTSATAAAGSATTATTQASTATTQATAASTSAANSANSASAAATSATSASSSATAAATSASQAATSATSAQNSALSVNSTLDQFVNLEYLQDWGLITSTPATINDYGTI